MVRLRHAKRVPAGIKDQTRNDKLQTANHKKSNSRAFAIEVELSVASHPAGLEFHQI